MCNDHKCCFTAGDVMKRFFYAAVASVVSASLIVPGMAMADGHGGGGHGGGNHGGSNRGGGVQRSGGSSAMRSQSSSRPGNTTRAVNRLGSSQGNSGHSNYQPVWTQRSASGYREPGPSLQQTQRTISNSVKQTQRRATKTGRVSGASHPGTGVFGLAGGGSDNPGGKPTVVPPYVKPQLSSVEKAALQAAVAVLAVGTVNDIVQAALTNLGQGSPLTITQAGALTAFLEDPDCLLESEAVQIIWTAFKDGKDDASGDELRLPEVGARGSAIYGLKITRLSDGTAAEQGLREGDVILSIAGVPTPTTDDSREVLAQAGRKVEVIFINVENGQRESIVLYPRGGLIGVDAESVQVE
jgi:hypothetical protein